MTLTEPHCPSFQACALTRKPILALGSWPTLNGGHLGPKHRSWRSCKLSFLVCCTSKSPDSFAGQELASQFQSYINSAGLRDPLQCRRASPMLSPTAVVAATMDAMQRNDYPDTDAGVKTAFLFSKPDGVEGLIASQALPGHVRSWLGFETWLTLEAFTKMLHSDPLSKLISFDSWQAVSPMTFPSQRSGNRAVQAVQVTSLADKARLFTYTFCLERIDVGPYKGCWLIGGVRCGDYANV